MGVTVDPDDADEIARLHELTRSLADDAVARGGTCTGEHGIGLGKIDALAREHPDLLPLYRGVKDAVRPAGDHEPRQGARPGRVSGRGAVLRGRRPADARGLGVWRKRGSA